jgi:hypothetical protein
MAAATPFLIRLVSSSVAIANRAGIVIRDVLKKGELGIVNKVTKLSQPYKYKAYQICQTIRQLSLFKRPPLTK